FQSSLPVAIQRPKSSTFSGGQPPSHGIVPSWRRPRIASAFDRTWSTSHRSKAKVIAARSDRRKSGLMSRAKLTGRSAAGMVMERTLDEALDEAERGLGDLAPAAVDRERMAAIRDLRDLGDAGVATLQL